MAKTTRPATLQQGSEGSTPTPLPPLYRPSERECALILLRLIQLKEEDSTNGITRVRIAEVSLKRMWGRHRLHPDFVEAVSGWLLSSGWVLFFAGSTYALIKASSVEGWARISSKAIRDDITAIENGQYDFASLEPLLRRDAISEDDD